MISVFCASRLMGYGDVPEPKPWLLDALNSVFAQEGHTVDEVVVALDEGQEHPKLDDKRVRFVNSDGHTQAKAVTAALREVRGDIVCGLEDDDVWSRDKLKIQLPYLAQGYDFVSSSVAEVHVVTGERRPNRPNAFISSWLMTRRCLDGVGPYFDERMAYHVDVEWLGRLNEHPEFKRMHLVEPEAMPPTVVMPELGVLAEWSIVRGVPEAPLVRRLVGYESRGIECGIRDDAKLKIKADGDFITKRFAGQGFPW